MSRKRQQHRERTNLNLETEQGAWSPCSFSGKVQTFKMLRPANSHQRAYVESIKSNIITLAIGSAGTGKTLLALHSAITLMNTESSPIEKIIYLRSNVGMVEEKDLGFLPGTLTEKIMPLAYPVLDNLIEFMEDHKARYLIESGRIEVLPVAMVRGRSFRNTFVIVDEAQNATPSMMKTLLTRISEGSKIVLVGDTSQCDLKATLKSGLLDAANRLNGLSEVGIIRFTDSDIIRHPIIADILARYND